MNKALVINGSPSLGKGNTAMVLEPFIKGMTDADCKIDTFYASKLKIKPCACVDMFCWYNKPGQCCYKDDMDKLYLRLKETDILVLATPVYIPLPGAMQNVINRLCPLVEPLLEFREGRTRARFRQDVKIKKIVLVSTGGWWEKANFDTVVRITEEFAKDAGAEFTGAVLRPHAFLMKHDGEFTKDGQDIVEAVSKAGYELVKEGRLSAEILENISRPLISEPELRERYNQFINR
jgi:multimeric flavodoxin WrbA